MVGAVEVVGFGDGEHAVVQAGDTVGCEPGGNGEGGAPGEERGGREARRGAGGGLGGEGGHGREVGEAEGPQVVEEGGRGA